MIKAVVIIAASYYVPDTIHPYREIMKPNSSIFSVLLCIDGNSAGTIVLAQGNVINSAITNTTITTFNFTQSETTIHNSKLK